VVGVRRVDVAALAVVSSAAEISFLSWVRRLTSPRRHETCRRSIRTRSSPIHTGRIPIGGQQVGQHPGADPVGLDAHVTHRPPLLGMRETTSATCPRGPGNRQRVIGRLEHHAVARRQALGEEFQGTTRPKNDTYGFAQRTREVAGVAPAEGAAARLRYAAMAKTRELPAILSWDLDLTIPLLIGGDEVGAHAGGTFASIDPSTGGQQAQVASASARDVDDAVAAARAPRSTVDGARRHRSSAGASSRRPRALAERREELARLDAPREGRRRPGRVHADRERVRQDECTLAR
jgi:hypothetical protein